MKVCKICTHEDRAEIERALAVGDSLRDIAGRFAGVTVAGLHRHRQNHLARDLAVSPRAAEIARADAVLETVQGQLGMIDDLRSKAAEIMRRVEIEDPATAVKAIGAVAALLRERRATLAMLAKVAGAVADRQRPGRSIVAEAVSHRMVRGFRVGIEPLDARDIPEAAMVSGYAHGIPEAEVIEADLMDDGDDGDDEAEEDAGPFRERG